MIIRVCFGMPICDMKTVSGISVSAILVALLLFFGVRGCGEGSLDDIPDLPVYSDNVPVEPHRGNILNDRGELMVSTLPLYKIHLDFVYQNKDSQKDTEETRHKRDSLWRTELKALSKGLNEIFPEKSAEKFEQEGFLVCNAEEPCDVYVINTCTVTAESDAKSRKYIRRAIRKNPDAVVIVMGCYSQRDPEAVARIEGVSAVLGTADKMKCVEIADRLLNAECRMQNAELWLKTFGFLPLVRL